MTSATCSMAWMRAAVDGGLSTPHTTADAASNFRRSSAPRSWEERTRSRSLHQRKEKNTFSET
jgi:hypothetical protein